MNWHEHEKKCAQELANCYTKELFDAKIREIERGLINPPSDFWSKIWTYYSPLPKTRAIRDSVNATDLFNLDAYVDQILSARIQSQGK